MKKFCLVLILFATVHAYPQSISDRLKAAVQSLGNDPQLRHGILGLTVADKSGNIIFQKNGEIGLAPASTQKIITSAAAFEILGSDFRYETNLGYPGNVSAGVLNGDMYIIGSGDPTLGSWRYRETKDSVILSSWSNAIQKTGIRRITGTIATIDSKFSQQAIPDGWIWQDIGNYYGAGSFGLNWRENQYDITLLPGNQGDSVTIGDTKPQLINSSYVNELRTAAKGTGDNAYIYLPIGNRKALIKGTIPTGAKTFTISGSISDPASQLLFELRYALAGKVQVEGNDITGRNAKRSDSIAFTIFHRHYSPRFDSINYWFMRRSVNLYGESLVKTISLQQDGFGSTERGIEILLDFWEKNGIEKTSFNIIDGSGLSPQNRVTTNALVKVLRYASGRPWFGNFYEALPSFNGMKMKSGSIGGARAFTGYHTSKDGKQYLFAIIVNNYNGSSSEVVKKMYRVLDILK